MTFPAGMIPVLSGAGLWTPEKLSSAVVWWDANRGVTESGGLVSSWADRIGAQTVTQGTGTLKPVYSATSLNGYPGLTFDGSDDVLSRASIPTGVPTAGSSGWIFALVDQQALVADTGVRIWVSYGTDGSDQARTVERRVASGTNRAAVENWSAAATEGTVDFSGINAILGSFTATTQQARINGADSASGSVTVNTATNRLRIGGGPAAAAALFGQGVVGHVLIGTGALSTGEKEKLEAWALWSVGKQSQLPSGHTYKNARP